jgi:hypothetical protein
MNRLNCESCGANIDARDIHRDLNIIKCRFCGALYDFQRSPQDKQSVELGSKKGKLAIPPRKYKVRQKHDQLEIRWSWLSPKIWFMVFFCIAWDSFLVVWYKNAFGSDGDVLTIVFPLLHVAAGVVITYSTLAGLFNSTVIRVSPQNIHIWRGPLPWTGTKSLSTDDIEQLYVKKVEHKSNDGQHLTYELHAAMKTKKDVKLISRLDEIGHALCLEQDIEEHLGIADREVAGEVQG